MLLLELLVTDHVVISVGVPMVTMVTQFWAKHPVVSVARAPVQTAPTVDATLLHLVTRTTVTDKSSATVTRATQVIRQGCSISP